jgi:phosphoglycolate phosphatase
MEKDIWQLEVITESEDRGNFKSVLFDFDGTISLIRQGWQNVMKPYFFELLKETPGAKDESEEALMNCIHEFVDVNTGRQTIYQCISLAEEIEKRGGAAQDAILYKEEYHRRLMDRIQYRVDGLESGSFLPEDYVVSGSFELLKLLRERGLTLYLASGTDEKYVFNEASLLGVTEYFNGGIYGAQADYKLFSKAMVVSRIITENDLHGKELLGFGDGYVEIENVKNAGGFAVGVASDEEKRCGIDEWKRDRLIKAKADIIIPDFSETGKLLGYLFKEG